MNPKLFDTFKETADRIAFLNRGKGISAPDVQNAIEKIYEKVIRDTPSLGIVSVTDFGVIGDGETDNTQALSEAMEYAFSNNLSLYFPPGIYMTGGIQINGNYDRISLIGAGPEVSVLKRLPDTVTERWSQTFQFRTSSPNSTFFAANIGFDQNARENPFRLPVTNISGNFIPGETVYLADNPDRTAIFQRGWDGILGLQDMSEGSFTEGSIIVGETSGATATITATISRWQYEQSHCIVFYINSASGGYWDSIVFDNVMLNDPTGDGVGFPSRNAYNKIIFNNFYNKQRNRPRLDVSLNGTWDKFIMVNSDVQSLSMETPSVGDNPTAIGTVLIANSHFGILAFNAARLAFASPPFALVSNVFVRELYGPGGHNVIIDGMTLKQRAYFRPTGNPASGIFISNSNITNDPSEKYQDSALVYVSANSPGVVSFHNVNFFTQNEDEDSSFEALVVMEPQSTRDSHLIVSSCKFLANLRAVLIRKQYRQRVTISDCDFYWDPGEDYTGPRYNVFYARTFGNHPFPHEPVSVFNNRVHGRLALLMNTNPSSLTDFTEESHPVIVNAYGNIYTAGDLRPLVGHYTGSDNSRLHHYAPPRDEGSYIVINMLGEYYESDTPPESGFWLKGQRVTRITPKAGEPLGFVCVESGSPGVWKGYGFVESDD